MSMKEESIIGGLFGIVCGLIIGIIHWIYYWYYDVIYNPFFEQYTWKQTSFYALIMICMFILWLFLGNYVNNIYGNKCINLFEIIIQGIISCIGS